MNSILIRMQILNEFDNLINETNRELRNSSSYEEYREKEKKLNGEKLEMVAEHFWDSDLMEKFAHSAFGSRDDPRYYPYGNYYIVISAKRAANGEVTLDRVYSAAKEFFERNSTTLGAGDLSPYFLWGVALFYKEIGRIFQEEVNKEFGVDIGYGFVDAFNELHLVFAYGSKELRDEILSRVREFLRDYRKSGEKSRNSKKKHYLAMEEAIIRLDAFVYHEKLFKKWKRDILQELFSDIPERILNKSNSEYGAGNYKSGAEVLQGNGDKEEV